MASSSPTHAEPELAAAEATLAKSLAPEDIRPGDFVTPLHLIAEVPSYFWCDDCWTLPRDQLVRIRYTPTAGGLPLKVMSVCLPFVLVKQASGERHTIDSRQCQLARLDHRYAKRAWKGYKKAQAKAAKARKN
jgi:hypothetical protein